MVRVKPAINPKTGIPMVGYLSYSDGRLFRDFKNCNGDKKFLKPLPYDNGYFSYRISIKGKAMNILVHRITACSFFGFSKLDVNHKDGDRGNNDVSNLEFVTRLDNIRHSLYTLKNVNKFKLGLDEFDTAKNLKEMGYTYRDIAKVLGVKSHKCVIELLKNIRHRVVFEYAERNNIQEQSNTSIEEIRKLLAVKNPGNV